MKALRTVVYVLMAVAVAWLFREQLPALAWPLLLGYVTWQFRDELRVLLTRVALSKDIDTPWLKVGEMAKDVQQARSVLRSVSDEPPGARLGDPATENGRLEVEA